MAARRGKNVSITTEINKQVKRYNAKVKRIVNKYPELKPLYKETLKISEVKKVVKKQSDLNKLIKTVDKLFVNENIKPIKIGEKLTLNKWAINEYEKDKKTVNKAKEKEFKILMDMPFKDTPYSFLQMGGTVGGDLRPITKSAEDFATTGEFRRMLKSVRFRSYPSYINYRNDMYKENLLKALEGFNVANEFVDNDGMIKKIDIKSLIEEIPSNRLVDFLKTSGEELHLFLNENYSVLQKQQRLTELVDIFRDLVSGKKLYSFISESD